MRPFKRLDAPDWLRDHAREWGEEYARRKSIDASYPFQWKSYQGQRVNQCLLDDLGKQTTHHCSYCDSFPLRRPDTTIDHFCPKGDERFYALVYAWENLYLACGNCQAAKREQYHEDLLRPDDPSFNFERYFVYNYADHKVKPNPDASEPEKRRAEKSIELFGFNDHAQTTLRRHAWERYCGVPDALRVLEDFPFRFMFL